ncbi:MAG TPA: polysaccharide pyruvyl transferase family protein, partial [Flavitalea sp.]|nr:polysaccharide pyruvyl transferase family protein [Flavitalea sp.]
LSEYNGNKLKLIMNGWFMHRSGNWPPSNHIIPLLTSFHLNSQVRDRLLSTESIKWFSRHGPVGCRDIYTFDLLSNAGVDAYISGCLTSTFQNNFNYRTNDIYFADVLFRVPGWSTSARTPREFLKAIFSGDVIKMNQRNRLLRELFDKDTLRHAKWISHYHPARHSEKERFSVAEDFLKKYATAKLVVTSRLHCALPCLAFGTPVIFIHFGFRNEYDSCRLKGVTDLFNTIYIDDKENFTPNFVLNGKINADFSIRNPETFTTNAHLMRNVCNAFTSDISAET